MGSKEVEGCRKRQRTVHTRERLPTHFLQSAILEHLIYHDPTKKPTLWVGSLCSNCAQLGTTRHLGNRHATSKTECFVQKIGRGERIRTSDPSVPNRCRN